MALKQQGKLDDKVFGETRLRRGGYGLGTVPKSFAASSLRSVRRCLNGEPKPTGFAEWYQTNVYHQRQAGYSTVTVNLPLGKQASWIVQGEEGSIEMRPGRKTPIYGVKAEDDLILDTDSLDLPPQERLLLAPDTARHAQLNASVLAGEASPAANQVALTAGTILNLVGTASDLSHGVRRAQKILTSGAAERRLELMRGLRSS